MRPELERLQRIEQQLLGNLKPGLGTEWEVQLLLDTELAADTEAQQLVYRGLYVAGRRQLRQELQHIHAQLYGPRADRWRQLVEAGRRAIQLSWFRLRRKK